MKLELYKLEKALDGKLTPALCSAWDYAQWHKDLPVDQQSHLGMILEKDTINGTTLTTIFLHTPCGFHDLSAQLWITQHTWDGGYKEQVYSSHRAALSGHRTSCRKLRKPDLKVMSEGA